MVDKAIDKIRTVMLSFTEKLFTLNLTDLLKATREPEYINANNIQVFKKIKILKSKMLV